MAVGVRGGIQNLLAESRRFEDAARAYVQSKLGETVILSQRQVGSADVGFDFLSFAGSGATARLFINEVKNETGRVGTRRFSVFNLGRTPLGRARTENLNNAIDIAIEAISDANLNRATEAALLAQLQGKTAAIRLIGSQIKGTRFDPRIVEKIGRTTGFVAGEGFNL